MSQIEKTSNVFNCAGTFVPHGSDIVEPLFDCSYSVWRIFVSPAGDFGYSGHWTFESATGFCHHSVVTKMEVQSLDYVGGLIFGACEQHKHDNDSKGTAATKPAAFKSQNSHLSHRPPRSFVPRSRRRCLALPGGTKPTTWIGSLARESRPASCGCRGGSWNHQAARRPQAEAPGRERCGSRR